MTIRGIGIPHEPALRLPCTGVKVPVGEVSVMPQPSLSGQPVSCMNRCATSSGSGAPPEPQNLSEPRSSLSTPGWLISAVNIVGTPGKLVTFSVVRSFSDRLDVEADMQDQLRARRGCRAAC